MGGAKLPYAAEVEYIGATGTQYIDIAAAATPGQYFGISGHVILPSAPTNNRVFFDAATASQFYNESLMTSGGAYVFGSVVGGVSTSGGWYVNVGAKTYFEVSTDGVTNNGVLSPLSRPITKAFSSVRLFAKLATGSRSPINNVQLFNITIKSGSATVFDAIPVRIGSGASAVGYLYDRVSGQLFGNAGTGAFVIGPDK
jgi:hypothetical protein